MAGEDTAMSFQTQLASQTWALYGIGMFMIVLRTYVISSHDVSLKLNAYFSGLHDGVAFEAPHSLR
jgi:hypothetical protein